jgi:allantoinase
MTEEVETTYVADSLRRFEVATGVVPRGWLGPSFSESTRTPGILSSLGLSYVCDWPNDEQPYLMQNLAEGLVSLPLMIEYDDNYSLIARNQPVEVYADAIRRGGARMALDAQTSPRYLGLSFNAWISGKPWRVRSVAGAVQSILALDGVIAASPGDVAEWTALTRSVGVGAS